MRDSFPSELLDRIKKETRTEFQLPSSRSNRDTRFIVTEEKTKEEKSQMEETKTMKDATKSGADFLRYVQLVEVLDDLRNKKVIDDYQYKELKARIMKKYQVSDDWLLLRNINNPNPMNQRREG